MSTFSSQFPYRENGGSENSSLQPKKQHYQNEGWGSGEGDGGVLVEVLILEAIPKSPTWPEGRFGAQGQGEDVLCWFFFLEQFGSEAAGRET